MHFPEPNSTRLSTDQMEEWTTAEAALFEEAMEKHGKTFNDIWTDYMPWKTVKVREGEKKMLLSGRVCYVGEGQPPTPRR